MYSRLNSSSATFSSLKPRSSVCAKSTTLFKNCVHFYAKVWYNFEPQNKWSIQNIDGSCRDDHCVCNETKKTIEQTSNDQHSPFIYLQHYKISIHCFLYKKCMVEFFWLTILLHTFLTTTILTTLEFSRESSPELTPNSIVSY